jgi:hypothetical protein
LYMMRGVMSRPVRAGTMEACTLEGGGMEPVEVTVVSSSLYEKHPTTNV